MCFSSTVVDSVGYYVDPTIIQVMYPKHQIMQEVWMHVKQLLLNTRALAELQVNKVI